MATEKKVNFMPCYEMKNDCRLFERLFKIQKNGTLLFGISFFCARDINFLYYPIRKEMI